VDFNRLYSDHQRLLIEAGRAPSDALRHEHEVAATHVAGRIGSMQRALGANAAAAWESLATPAVDTLAWPRRHPQGCAA
jgi:hypothetical protein